jgi:hypothetical protein
MPEHADKHRLLDVQARLLLSLPASTVHHGLEPALEQSTDAGVRHRWHHHGLDRHVIPETHIESCAYHTTIYAKSRVHHISRMCHVSLLSGSTVLAAHSTACSRPLTVLIHYQAHAWTTQLKLDTEHADSATLPTAKAAV